MPGRVGRRGYVKYGIAGAAIVAVVSVGAYYTTKPRLTPTPAPGAPGAFTLRSEDFEEGGIIPSKFTCDGEDVSPQLSWENAPKGTKSFALSVVDPDAPGGTFVHWLVYDIPSNVREVERGRLPEGAKQIENDFGERGYRGPCPPSGTHRYVFTLYALDVEHLEDVNRDNFFGVVKVHAIGEAKLTGLYARK